MERGHSCPLLKITTPKTPKRVRSKDRARFGFDSLRSEAVGQIRASQSTRLFLSSVERRPMPSSPSTPLVQVMDAHKDYVLGHRTVHALRGLTLDIPAGGFVVMQGPSGSGKTTLLNLIGCIDRPTAGRVLVAGQDTRELNDTELSAFRARKLGFVFQNFNLIPVLTAAENVEYPLRIRGVETREARRRAVGMLEEVGLALEADQRPAELSGGQCQRVAIARALVSRPELVIADEPTANLDSENGAMIIRTMRALRDRAGTSFVISTHDPEVAVQADQRWLLRDGHVCTS